MRWDTDNQKLSQNQYIINNYRVSNKLVKSYLIIPYNAHP